MSSNMLKAPSNLVINFKPSPKQYELWEMLQPNHCPKCGGTISHKLIGEDRDGNPQYKPQCDECGSRDLPQMILGGGAAGGGKMCLLNSAVCTPEGYVKVEDLKVGDVITSATTGKTQKIIYLHPIEKHLFYRIEFEDGTHVDCSEGHLWNIKPGLEQRQVWSTKKMCEYLKRDRVNEHLSVPLCKPVTFRYNKIDRIQTMGSPYAIGCVVACLMNDFLEIGDFCTYINIENISVIENLQNAGYPLVSNNNAASYTCKVVNDRFFKRIALEYMDSQKKRGGHFSVPEGIKHGTLQERRDFLKAVFDICASVNDEGQIVYVSKHNEFAQDVAYMCRSLGGNVKVSSVGSLTSVLILTAENSLLVSSARHKKKCIIVPEEYLLKQITSIKPIGERLGRCITVSEDCGLYLTDNFTVTHNSFLGSSWIILSCMQFPNIRAVVARKTIKSLKESTFNTIKIILKNWGLQEGRNYKINNLEGTVTFWNDSTIILKEMVDLPSDPNFERFGSSEYSIAFIDEVSEISERAVEVLFSRLRWNLQDTFKIPRMLMTTNPCINWVRSRFVQDDDGDPIICNEGEAYVPFSLFDNPNLEFRKIYEASLNKIRDKATKERLLYGNWDFIDTNDMAAYWQFNGEKHLVGGLKEKVYDPMKPIIISWDFNVSPFMSTLAFQIDYDKKEIYVLEEILGKPEDKENNTPRLSQKLRDKYTLEKHLGGIIVTGDPAGLSRSTQTEDGVNNFTIIMNNLKSSLLRPQKRILRKQPPQTARLEFINNLLGGYDGWKIFIDLRCRKFTEDLVYQKKNADGTKSKAKVTDPKSGVKYEKYGHLSDCFDYFVCMFAEKSWEKFLGGSHSILTTSSPIYNNFTF